MEYDSVGAVEFGRSLRGIGVNILVRDVTATVAFLTQTFGMRAHQPTADFAILTLGSAVFQIHADGTYHANPLLGLLPDNPPRGAGVEIRLYEADPDEAAARTLAAGGTILQAPANKPHGLREAYILGPDGHAFVPSRPLREEEIP